MTRQAEIEFIQAALAEIDKRWFDGEDLDEAWYTLQARLNILIVDQSA